MSTPAFYWGTGRRKTAVARIRLLPGEGQMVINGKTPEEFFGGILPEAELWMPFRVTGTEGRYNTMIKVEGGGVTGQSGAIRHGIARALLQVDPDNRRLAAPGRPPHPRPADEGAQEVRPQARPQGPPVHEALIVGAWSGRSRRCRLRCSLTHPRVRSLRSSPAPWARRASRRRVAQSKYDDRPWFVRTAGVLIRWLRRLDWAACAGVTSFPRRT